MSNAAINLGSCWGTPSGQDLSSPAYMASGFQCVGEAIARRWGTSPGQLIDDPNYGYNLTDLVSDDIDASDLPRIQQRAAAEALKDERVLGCIVQMTLPTSGVLTVTAQVTTAAGPFKLVVAVSAVTTAILLVSP